MQLNYEKDVQIDQNTLDVEWCKQPILFAVYSEQAAKAKAALDKAKDVYDQVYAETNFAIRKTPVSYWERIMGDEKPPKIVEAFYTSMLDIVRMREGEELNKARIVYAEAKYNYDIVSSATKTLDQKKTALEYLVKLLQLNYFSTPVAEDADDKEWGEAAEEKQSANLRKRASLQLVVDNTEGKE